MAESMVWGTWPLVADLNSDSVMAAGAVPDDPARYQISNGDGDEGLKRRAACDECREQPVAEDISICVNKIQANAN